MKVLPNVVDKPEPDIIEKLKKEEHIFHYKKDVELITSNENAIETNEIGPTLKTPTTFDNKLIMPASEMAITEGVTEHESMMTSEIKDFEKTAFSPKLDLATDAYERDLISNEIIPATFDSPERKIYGDDLDNEDIDEEQEEEEASSEYDYKEYEKKKQENYTSRQHTLPSSTLLHGFIANPGYPSYYIGNDKAKECKWRLRMAKGQRMLLTILDLHLRSESMRKIFH